MTLLTPTEATKRLCPIARISARQGKTPDDVPATCCGPQCTLWRWKAITTNDHRFLSAVAREAALIEEERQGKTDKPKKSATSEAAERVGFAVDRYIVRTDDDKGWCGLGGRPE
jgi:hypothetical protein